MLPRRGTLRTSEQSGGSSGNGDRGSSGNTGIGNRPRHRGIQSISDPGSCRELTVSRRRRRRGDGAAAGSSSHGCAGSELPVVVAARPGGGPRPAAVLA